MWGGRGGEIGHLVVMSFVKNADFGFGKIVKAKEQKKKGGLSTQ